MDKYTSENYDKLKEILNFEGLKDDEGKKLLQKLYIDVVCASEIGARKDFKDKENHTQNVKNSLYFSYEESKEIDINPDFINDIEAINGSAICTIKDDTEIFYKLEDKQPIYHNVNNNQKYCFLTKNFEKKEAKNGWKFNKDDYEWVYAEFDEIKDYSKQKKIIKGNELFFFKEGEAKKIKSNQLVIFIDGKHVKCIGSQEMRKEFKIHLEENGYTIYLNNYEISIIRSKNKKNGKDKDFEYNSSKNLNEIFPLEKFTKIEAFKIKSSLIDSNEIYCYTDDSKNKESLEDLEDSYISKIELFRPKNEYVASIKEKVYFFKSLKSLKREQNIIYSLYHSSLEYKKIILLKKIDKEPSQIKYKIEETNFYSFLDSDDFYIKKSISLEPITIDMIYPYEIKLGKVNKIKNNHILMVNEKNYKNDYIQILSRLRNAVAHIRIRLDNDFIIFENINKQKINLLAKIHKVNIDNFINTLLEKIK